MGCIETFATLRIFSKNISPEIIGKRLDIAATKMLPLDPQSHSRSRRECNLWSVSTEGKITSFDNSKHLLKIIELLKGKENLLSALREEGCNMDIFCYWVSTGNEGLVLSLETMECLLKFGLEIHWDIYFDSESDT